MSLIASLVNQAAERERLIVADPQEWHLEHPERKCIQGRDHLTDVTDGTARAIRVIPVDQAPILEVELARPWLRHVHQTSRPKKGMAARRVPWDKEALGFLDLLPPKWWGGEPLAGDFAYVDLTRAYPSIYGALTLDVRFRPNAGDPSLSWGRFDFAGIDEVWKIKGLHLACGGIFRASKISYSQAGKVWIEEAMWNPYLAPDLWGVMMLTLHSIAESAVSRFGAVLWNVDGGILPRESAEGFIAWLREDWLLESRVKSGAEGEGVVYGLGHHAIGTVSTEIVETVCSVPSRYVLKVPSDVQRCMKAARWARL